MAAPTPAVRTIPTTFKMPDGFSTEIVFTSNVSIAFWEQTIKPPSADGGEPIPTTTMLNVAWRTFDHRHLKTLVPFNVNAMFDPDVIPNLFSLINLSDTVTVKFPDGSTLCFFGFLQKYEHSEHKEGEPPMITLTIVPTNWDAAGNVEAGPVFTPASGT
jgi:hypothetical protein